MRILRNRRTWLAASAAAAGLGVAVASVATASAANTHRQTTYRLVVDAPIFGRGPGTSVLSFGSVKIQVGRSSWCYAPPLNTVSGSGSGTIRFSLPYRVVKGWTYTVSAWDGAQCDKGGRFEAQGSLGQATAAANSSGSTWIMTVPRNF